MPSLEPLFPYAGSKRDLISNFSIYLERTTHYIEPFFGGGSVWCYMHNHGLADHYVINDNNSELMGLYADIKNNPDNVIVEAKELEAAYKGLPLDELEYNFISVLDAYKRKQTSGKLLFLANACFGGHWNRDSRGLFNGHSGHQISQKSPNRIIVSDQQVRLWHAALQRTDICVGDYREITIPTNSIVFCDPPYRGAKNDYDRPFSDEEQVDMFNWCNKIACDGNVSVIQTNRSDRKFFEGLFQSVEFGKLIHYDHTYSNSPSKKRFREIVMIWNPLFNDPQRFGLFLE